MSAAPKSVGLFKRAWNEVPDVVGSSFMGGIGLIMCGIGLKMYYDKDGDNRKHKMQYTVWRHDDPRVANIRKD